MIDELEELVDNFRGACNRTRCFLHIVNLVAKSLLKQFDLHKKNGESDDDVELSELANGLEEERFDGGQIRDDDEGLDDAEGLIDEVALLSEAERSDLLDEIRPVKIVLGKVSDEKNSKKKNTY